MATRKQREERELMFQYLNNLTSTHWAPLPKGVYHAHIAPQAGEEAFSM